MKRIIIQIVLMLVIIVLGYLVYESINKPVKFNSDKKDRNAKVIQDLKDIRSVQLMYKKMNHEYAANIDTLVTFLRYDMIPIVKQTQDPNDTTFSITISDTIGYISVVDSLFGKRPGFNIDSLSYIPESGVLYTLQAGKIKEGGLMVHVFEASAHYENILKGLDNQLIVNLIKSELEYKKFPGLKVGSMEEPSIDGNWE